MFISCSPFFCNDDTSDTNFLNKNAIELHPPKLEKVSLKKNNNEIAYRTQNLMDNKQRNSDVFFESDDFTRRIIFLNRKSFFRKSVQYYRTSVNES